MLLWRVRFILAKEQKRVRKWKTKPNLENRRRKKMQTRNLIALKRTTEQPNRERIYDGHVDWTSCCSAVPWRETNFPYNFWIYWGGGKEAEITEVKRLLCWNTPVYVLILAICLVTGKVMFNTSNWLLQFVFFLCFCCCLKLTCKPVSNVTSSLSGKEEIQSERTAMFMCSSRVHLGYKSWLCILLLSSGVLCEKSLLEARLVDSGGKAA